MTQEATKILQELANALGVNIHHLWKTLLKQAQIQIILNSMYLVAFATLATLYISKFRFMINKIIEHKPEQYENFSGWIFPLVIGAITLVICFIISIDFIGEIITCLLNPDYWALQQILGAVK